MQKTRPAVLFALILVGFFGAPQESFSDDSDQDIIRLLPPAPDAPLLLEPPKPMPVLPPLPKAPEAKATSPLLTADGRELKVKVRIAPAPGHPESGTIAVRWETLSDASITATLGLAQQTAVTVAEPARSMMPSPGDLRQGDFVLAVGTTPVATARDLADAVRVLAPGSEITLTVWRLGRDDEGSLDAVARLAQLGSTPAMLVMGRYYERATSQSTTPLDMPQALSWYRRAADAGNTTAMLALGDALAKGKHVPQDLDQALHWITRAADAGDPAGLWRLACMYRDGEGLDRAPEKAISLLKKAAEAGFSAAYVAIGFMLEGGSGIAPDREQAAYWFGQAASLDNAEGMALLGAKYSAGRGVEKNFATAVDWYREAARRGQPMAAHNLASMYDLGQGVETNPEKAADYIFEALEMRHPFTFQQMSTNSEVWSEEFRRALEQRLADVGYEDISVDGRFDPATLRAIDHLAKTAD